MDGANNKKVKQNVNWTLKLYIKPRKSTWKMTCFFKVVALKLIYCRYQMQFLSWLVRDGFNLQYRFKHRFIHYHSFQISAESTNT